MKLFALAALLLVQLPSAQQSRAPARQESAGSGSDLVVLWSAGIDALLVDGRDKGLAGALGMLDDRLAEIGRDLEDPTFPSDAVRLERPGASDSSVTAIRHRPLAGRSY